MGRDVELESSGVPAPPMKATRRSTERSKRDSLVGTWVNGSEYASEVQFTITRSGDSYAVRARDGYDGEESEVFDTAWNGEVLSFAAHWKSTGRFARYRLLLLSTNRLDVTYTYTDNEMYHRKATKRKS